MHYLRHLLLSASLITLAGMAGRAAGDSSQTNMQVVGLMVVAPSGGTDNRNYCWKPGVTVSVRYAPAAGKIVSFDENASKLTAFTDDQGTDLMAAAPSTDPFNKPGISGMLPMANEGAASIIVDLKASGQPAKGATAFIITGQATLEIALGTKQFTLDNVAVRTNTAFSLGDLPVLITAAGTNQNAWNAKDFKYSVTLSSLREMKSISTLEFFDAAGNKVPAEKRGWGGSPLGYMMQYDLKEPMDHARIVATCWQDLQTVTVPIAVKASVGL